MESGCDPMGDFIVKGSTIPLIIGIIAIIFGMFLSALILILNFLGSRHDPPGSLAFVLGYCTVVILLGVFGVIYWGSWIFKVENGVLTYKRMFEKRVVIPVTDIFRAHIGVMPGYRYEGIFIFNNKNKKIISIRNTQTGYGLFKQRIQAVLPPGAITTNALQS